MVMNGQSANTVKRLTDTKTPDLEARWSYKIQRMGGLTRISLLINVSAAELVSPHATASDSR
jgi:hypothetical protein